MADSIRSILDRLAPIADKVILRPLSEAELEALEASVGMPMPSCAREYFALAGIFEDLTAYGTSDYEVIDRPDQFPQDRQFLLKHFGQPAADLFPFAGDGAGDIIAVAEGEEGGMLYFADHETAKIKKIGPFTDWLASVVSAALTGRRPANTEKKWCVQFSFNAQSPASILAVLGQFGSVNLGTWSEPKVSPAKVYSSEAPLTFGQERLVLKRSEFHAWDKPKFYFDFEEPPNLADSASMIRKLHTSFRNAGLDYKLVDYGPLAMGWNREESASGGPLKTREPQWWSWLTRPFRF